MADETQTRMPQNGRHSSDEWLLGLVKEMVVSILNERDLRYQERFEAQQEALAKVEDATEKRFESVNEFRKAMTDRDILYMPRSEATQNWGNAIDKISSLSKEGVNARESISSRIDALSKRFDTLEGTMAGSKTMLMGIGGLAAFLVAAIIVGTWTFSNRQPADQQSVAAAAAAAAVLATAAAAAKVSPPPPQVIYLPQEQLNKLAPR